MGDPLCVVADAPAPASTVGSRERKEQGLAIASLRVSGPGDESFVYELVASPVTVGREFPGADTDLKIADPDRRVSRLHFLLEHEWGAWWVVDNASANGTYLRRGSDRVRIEDRIRLDHGDVIVVLAGQDLTWELQLDDPHATTRLDTEDAPVSAARPCVVWDPDMFTLTRHSGVDETVVELRRQGYVLVDHMWSRNGSSRGAPVVCTPDDLIEAVWGSPSSWDEYHPPTAENLRDLVADVRKSLEIPDASKRILENVRGVGYRLHTCPA